MSQPEGKGSGALEVKFVPDEEVLKHIADDAGNRRPGAAPSPAPPAAPRAVGEGSQQRGSPYPSTRGG